MVIRSINDYKKRMTRFKDVKSVTVNHSIRTISSFFKHSPSYEEVIINGTNVVPSQIVTDTKIPTVKTILIHPGYIIKAGNIVSRNNGEDWLCLYDDPNPVHVSGKIERCNYTLKWIDDEGTVQVHPSVLYFNTRSNFGIEEDRKMNMPDGRRQVTLQRNESTEKLTRDLRFIFGNEAFRIIDVDFVSDAGLVNISLDSDQINPEDDDIDLGIANYRSRISNYKIKILNGSFTSIDQDQTLNLNIAVFNKDTEIINPGVKFVVDNDSLATVSDAGVVNPLSTGRIKVTVHFKNVSASIDIQITDSTSYNYTVDIDGEESIRVGRSSTYTCQFKVNGATIFDESTFSLTSIDGSSTDLAVIDEQDSKRQSCVIKANDKQMYGDVFLHVSNLNGLSKGYKKIKIKSLF